MNRSILLSAVALLAISVLPGEAATSAYTCTTFSPGNPSGINDKGQIIGTVPGTPPQSSKGFLRAPDGTMTTIVFPGTDNSIATQLTAINNPGQIVGYYFNNVNEVYHAFIRNADGSYLEIDPPPTPPSIQAIMQFRITGLNDNGMMVGDFTDGGNQRFLFSRDANGKYTMTGTQPVYHNLAYAAGPLNNSGVELLPSQTVIDGYLSIPGQPLLQLLLDPGGLNYGLTQTRGLNNNNVTAGTLLGAGFLRTPDLHFPTIVCPDNLNAGLLVSAVNNSNVVVGQLFDNSTAAAFIATPTGITPQVELSNTSWDFGTLAPGTTASGTVYVTNTGNGFLHIANLPKYALGDQYPADYAITGTSCNGEIGIQHTCSVSFSFTPSAGGVRTNRIVIIDDAPDSPQVINLHGVGASVSLQISNPSWFLGNYPVGQTSATGTIYFYANGTDPVSFAGTAIEGANASEFFITNNTCGSTVAAYRTCAISFAYKPAAPGFRNAFLALHDNAAGGPYTIPLSGFGY